MENKSNKRTDPQAADHLARNKDKKEEGHNEVSKFEKENTVQVEIEGEDTISTMELMRNIGLVCGGLLACRLITQRKYEVTVSNLTAKKRLLDGFKIGETRVLAKELIKDTLVVSFLGLPAYITDVEILQKLHGWGVSAVSEVKRRVWPGTKIADGTRFVKVKFTDTVQSLPYSVRFNIAMGPEYFRVIHDKQVRVCRICIQPGHILKDCPDFLCHSCGQQGHYARECSGKRNEDKCAICSFTMANCICEATEAEREDSVFVNDELSSEGGSGGENEMEEGTSLEKKCAGHLRLSWT
ncbi:uncharacterized protein LOC106511884 [Austrofundulus limnaeus]|uniref:Uncharacterized protein LOC106511884 n=1 Tax=Austrofundulus limnaeus TaxID=52670 RepID=A0A2I4AKP4_AUSLI|nr:PREDICTED: uncharacterized protein LOC106511884 [Austrofundulus limnaeus]